MKNVVLSGVAEGWRVAKEIADAGVPVITGPMLSTPTRASDRYDRPYANAGMMHKAGVKVAIRSNDSENVRNLPFNAGFAAAYGMGKKAALEAVTIIPAQIFGVDDQIGSLEVGKVANLFVADGDPFEPRTQIKHVFIDGYQIAIDSSDRKSLTFCPEALCNQVVWQCLLHPLLQWDDGSTEVHHLGNRVEAASKNLHLGVFDEQVVVSLQQGLGGQH